MEQPTLNLTAPFRSIPNAGDVLIKFRFEAPFNEPSVILDKVVVEVDGDDQEYLLQLEDRIISKFVMTMINSFSQHAEPDTLFNACTFKHKFVSYTQGQMGRGFVSAEPPNPQESEIPVFVHVNSENNDPKVMRDVELQTQLFARLLNNFRIDPEAIARIAEFHKTTEIVE